LLERSKNVGDPDASFGQAVGDWRRRIELDARGIDAKDVVAKRMTTMKKKALLIETRLAAKGRKAVTRRRHRLG
jgi:hypothetical protein